MKNPKPGNKAPEMNIKALRAANGWTQEQFAALVGATLRTVSRWETGEASPSKMALYRIADLRKIRRDKREARKLSNLTPVSRSGL